jgi:hypothetical protein
MVANRDLNLFTMVNNADGVADPNLFTMVNNITECRQFRCPIPAD